MGAGAADDAVTVGTEYQRLADDVRAAILTGALAPGDRLVEADLAEQYDVSRGTVREAFRLLASQHLVETMRGRSGGTYVARVVPERISDYLQTTMGVLLTHAGIDLSDLVQIRQLIEPFAASLAAARHESGPAVELRELQAPASSPERDDMNWAWHRTVLRLSGNPLLPALATPVYEALTTRFDRSNGRRGYFTKIEQEHAEITSLIEAGDAKGAEAAMREHLEVVHLTYLDLAAAT